MSATITLLVRDRSDPYDFTHVFRALGFDIEFGAVGETRVPIILSAPSDIPSGSPYKCLYDCAYTNTTSRVVLTPAPLHGAFEGEFLKIKPRLLSLRTTPATPDEFSLTQLLVCETIGHRMRQAACFELDEVVRKRKFEEAYDVYEGVILSIRHSSINESVLKIRNGPKHAILFQQVSEFEKFNPESRRLLSHCFAGMAICSLMNDRSTNKYISLASEAVCLETKRPLELACTLRVLPLIMSSAPHLEHAFKTYVMHKEISTKVLLPLMLQLGRHDLYDTELGFIDSDMRPQCAEFATSMVRRVALRKSSPAPLATVHTHIKDGKILERTCAACGVWDRTGGNHRRCNGCRLVYYCGKECQVAHWAEHKGGCVKK